MALQRIIELKSLYKTQNADKTARKSDYAHLGPKELLVRSMFATLQGEGPYVGTPCIFVRLAGCNLGNKEEFCQWCDTDFRLSDAKVMSFDDVRDRMYELWTENIKDRSVPYLLVLTGGEPGLQPNTVKFLEYMHAYRWNSQVETNGTQATLPNGIGEIENKVLLVVSPKAGPNGYGALSIPLWAGKQRRNVLKLVVDADPRASHHFDDRAKALAREWANLCGPRSVYLSPMAIYAREYKGEISSAWEEGLIDKERTRKNYNYAYQQCLENGYLLSIQQHLFAEAP